MTKSVFENQYVALEQPNLLSALKDGVFHRLDRLDKADMLTTDEAAALAGTSRVTINSWVAKNRCLGLDRTARGLRIPSWQFSHLVFPYIRQLFPALQTTDSWVVLNWLETPLGALEGRTPLAALSQGDDHLVMNLANMGV